MNIFSNIIHTLGETLADYNVGAWAMLRDQLATEISSQYIFGSGRKDDESLLEYSLGSIERSNRIVRGGNANGVKFTYFTPDGPETSIEVAPILTDPITDKLKLTRDYKPFIKEGTEKWNNESAGVTYEVYDEANKGGHTGGFSGNLVGVEALGTENYGLNPSSYTDGRTLLSKTQAWFHNKTGDYISRRFATLMSRFHSDNSQVTDEDLESASLQASSKEFGLSRGMALRKANNDGNVPNENGYEDPWCRVWTWHKQYRRYIKDTIRPLSKDGKAVSQENLSKTYGWNVFRGTDSSTGYDGGDRLAEYGVMYDNNKDTNGLVNITPTNDNNGHVDVRKCMFSIENLAWKGTYEGRQGEVNGLSSEQKGPLGGRIMWFPPYEMKFNENTQANWNKNDFIGRGEPIYTYTNTTRSGTLSFKMLIDHPAILDYWEGRDNGKSDYTGIDDLESNENKLLRFFSGCEVLRSKTAQHDNDIPSENDKRKSEERKRNALNEVRGQGNRISFVVYYPNNYSGKNDWNTIDPIEYIVNGVGTNIPEHDMVLSTGGGATLLHDGEQVGGYEMRSGKGISIVTAQTETNLITQIEYDGRNVDIMKMMKTPPAMKETTGDTKEWYDYRYYYRVDTDRLDQKFVHESSYIDIGSSQMNSSGYASAASEAEIKRESLCSLVDFYVALRPSESKVYDGLYNEERVETIRGVLNGSKGKITKIVGIGRASNQDNNESKQVGEERNITLAESRARTAVKWILGQIGNEGVEVDISKYDIDPSTEAVDKDANNRKAKLNRFAVVDIYYGDSVTEDYEPNVGGGDPSNTYTIKERQEKVDLVGNNYEDEDNENEKPADERYLGRYDNEAEFFKRIGKEDPFITKLICERIKNFSPVFHSMTPEGFNARLTFLQQCMRQGPTISGLDTVGINANNLAFGRPPVCVLRVGDFYNTKVVINSLNIEYDPLMWDLNHEGIGVMPMIANITLGFDFIGGSDLGGPIQRLQNATSFNYYSNASVYDNRAERIDYEYGGKMKSFVAYEPIK